MGKSTDTTERHASRRSFTLTESLVKLFNKKQKKPKTKTSKLTLSCYQMTSNNDLDRSIYRQIEYANTKERVAIILLCHGINDQIVENILNKVEKKTQCKWITIEGSPPGYRVSYRLNTQSLQLLSNWLVKHPGVESIQLYNLYYENLTADRFTIANTDYSNGAATLVQPSSKNQYKNTRSLKKENPSTNTP